MAQYKYLQSENHLMALGQTFAYIKKYLRSIIVFDRTYSDFSYKQFIETDW